VSLELDIRKDVLFVGLGVSAVCYYRVMLPAMTLGADWSGLVGEPPHHKWVTGIVKKESQMPQFTDYKVVVLQQPVGRGWIALIKGMQEQGIKVVYEVDDYVHGIKFNLDHGFRRKFDNQYLSRAEASMKACDAIFTTTEWIAGNYLSFNKNVYICQNGLDLRRYELTRPRRESVNIGWAGATGHQDTVIPWLQAVAEIMRLRPNACFISIGEPFAEGFVPHFGRERAMAIPFAQVEQYPAAMTMFDIAIAPGGKGGWWRGKSDLRWLEAGALGIPIVASPAIYPEIEDGVTGLHAKTRFEAFEKMLLLFDHKDLRETIGQKAKEYVREHRSIEAMAPQWEAALNEVYASD
jgi:glycosyltransferase involved in cell wall biosynthesis